MIPSISPLSCLLALCVLVVGCAPITGVLDEKVEVRPGESIFVLGITPRNYYVVVTRTEVEGGVQLKPGFEYVSASGSANVVGRPTDGFVMWKGGTNQLFHIVRAKFLEHEDHGLGPEVLPCGDVTTRVYSAAGGKVVYLGDVQFSRDGSSFKESFSDRFEAAQLYMDQRFPQLRGQLVRGASQVVKTRRPCEQRSYMY